MKDREVQKIAARASRRRGLPPRPRTKATHAFGFLDETGTLGGERDPFFAVGLLHCCKPHELMRPIQRIRDRYHLYEEIKWNKVSRKKLPVLNELIDVMLSYRPTLHAFVVDKREHDVITRFGGQFKAYEWFARQLVHGSIGRGETMWVVADEYSTPPGEAFEENVRDYVNRKLKREAIAGVCRMRSSGVDLLQIVDLMLGAIVYEYKAETGLVEAAKYRPKVELLEHLREGLGVPTFAKSKIRNALLNLERYHG